MTLKELESYIKLAKRHKLKSFSVDGITFEFREPSKRHKISAVTQGQIDQQGGMPSDDEMLYYSAGSQIEPAAST